MSGNTLGGQVWSDGYRYFPMIYIPPDVGTCSSCSRIFFVDKCRELGYLSGGWFHSESEPKDPDEWLSAPLLGPMSAERLLAAVEQGFARSRKAETRLRMQAWWDHNRDLRGTSVPLAKDWRPPSFTTNLERLLALAQRRPMLRRRSDGQTVIVAELFRELGRFEEATTAYANVGPEYAQHVLEALLDAAKRKDPYPVNLTSFLTSD